MLRATFITIISEYYLVGMRITKIRRVESGNTPPIFMSSPIIRPLYLSLAHCGSARRGHVFKGI